MCYEREEVNRVRLHRCGHGTFHLNIGLMTLHLSAEELVLLHSAIERWFARHPE